MCFRPCLRLAHVRSRHAPADWSAITEQPDANIELAQLRQDRGLSDERVRVAARQRLPAQPIARVVADASRVTGPVSTWARRRARSGTARPLVACSRSSRTDSSPMRYCRVTAPTARPGFPARLLSGPRPRRPAGRTPPPARRSRRWCGPPGAPGRRGTASSPTPGPETQPTAAPVPAPASISSSRRVLRLPPGQPHPGPGTQQDRFRRRSGYGQTQSRQRPLDHGALGRRLPRQRGVVGPRVMSDQRGVDQRDPPHRLTDHRERPRPVPCSHPARPFGGFPHRGKGPLQCTRPGRLIA